MTKYKNRKAVPAKYKWDRSFLLDGKDLDKQIKELIRLEKKLIAVKDSKYKTEEAFINALKIEDKTSILLNKISNYLHNWVNENVTNPEPNQLMEKLSFEMYKLSLEMGPEAPRIFANEAKIKKYLKNPKLKNYKSGFEMVFETKKHQLPKAIQEFRTKSSRGDINVSSPFATLTDAELVFEDAIDSKGKKHKVNHSTLQTLTKSKDAKLRKDAVIKYRAAYMNHKQTLSNFIFQHFKSETVEAKLKKFPSVIDYLVFSDRSSDKLLQSLYKATQDHKQLKVKALNVHKKIYKAKYGKAMTKYDKSMPLVSIKSEYTIEEHKKMVLEAVKPFGKEYVEVTKKAFKENWIDFVSYPGKRTGAYSIGGTYGVDKKLILMNDHGDIRSTETLAHELGHSMHSYFSDKNQHFRESAYKIFVAEIASIFNELMLFDHLLNTSNDKKLKLQILQQIIEGFNGTVFRQVEWSNYEYDLYSAIEKGQPISTYEAVSKMYIENAKKYSGKKNFKMTSEEAYSAIRIPHFYYGFYVYKYAIGQICANIFFQRYKENGKEALQDFIKNFLSMGNKLKPLELLKHNGIDLEDPKTYSEGFKVLEKTINEWNKLSKEVYKNIK